MKILAAICAVILSGMFIAVMIVPRLATDAGSFCSEDMQKMYTLVDRIRSAVKRKVMEEILGHVEPQTGVTEFYPGYDLRLTDQTPSSNQSSFTVHYIWCQDAFFTYLNYLSVLSVVKHIKPMKIVFYYTKFPRLDRNEYFTWFKDIQQIPFLVLHQLDHNHDCDKSPTAKLKTVVEHLNRDGGIYIGEDTILGKVPTNLLIQTNLFIMPDPNQMMVSNATHANSIIKRLNGVIAVPGPPLSNTTFESKMTCCIIRDLQEFPDYCICVVPILDRVLYPRSFWDVDNNVGRLFRSIAYGRDDLIKPQQNFTDLAPRISHYIWYGKRAFDFSHYLSVLSAIYVAGWNQVIFHGDVEPYGKYWDLLKEKENLLFSRTELPQSVFGKAIKLGAHANDVVKMYILDKYGGVHQDPDVYWVNYVSDEELAYDSVMGFEWLQQGVWPETFNIGVLIAKRGSTYIKEYTKTLTDFRDNLWAYNSRLVTYRTYEKFPTTLFADRHLSVICFLHTCHPPWVSNYNAYRIKSQSKQSSFDWRRDTLSIHNTLPKPYEELQNLESLMKNNSMFAEIGRFILQKAKYL